jgi:hypothetical protein
MANEISLAAALSLNNPVATVSPGLGWSRTQQFTQTGLFNSEGTVLVPANLSGTITNATNANPIVFTTSAAHNLVNGDTVTTIGILGNTAANTTGIATVIDTVTFSLPIAGNGAYTSGGTFTTANGIAIPLGQVTTPHWAFLQNLDAANYLQIRNGQAGAVLLRLLAGEPAFFPFDPTATPWALANTSAVVLQFGILSL